LPPAGKLAQGGPLLVEENAQGGEITRPAAPRRLDLRAEEGA
jgi:hypothetical protein